MRGVSSAVVPAIRQWRSPRHLTFLKVALESELDVAVEHGVLTLMHRREILRAQFMRTQHRLLLRGLAQPFPTQLVLDLFHLQYQ